MKHNYSNKNQHEEFFGNIEIPYSKSKEEVWASIVEQRKTMPQRKPKMRKMLVQWSIAAAIAALLGVTAFMRFYTITIYAPTGEHVAQLLPDSSKVHLNAMTKVKYNPYWWRVKRRVILEGEAYFEVNKGKTFEVISAMGETRVLGTSFNIFARGNQYNVHCLTGKVAVKSPKGIKKVLLPEQAASVHPNGEVTLTENVIGEHVISWTKNEFIFTAAPLSIVFEEMERQFGIQIICDKNISGAYTGNFKRGSSPEEILNIISKPFGLKVVKIHGSKYKITQ